MANGGRFWLKGQAGVKVSGRGRLKGKGELEILITFWIYANSYLSM